MKAEILCVGTELLMGQIVNTNAAYLSKRLPDLGIGVYYQTVVGDNHERVDECLKIAISRCDMIIMTGGLGPTKDDMTKEAVAALFNKKLVLHEPSLKRIEEFFKSIDREMTENNKRQAYFPEGAEIFQNNHGTAPGCMLEKDGKCIILLPGPPKEMVPMFEECVIKRFEKRNEWILVSKFLKVFGIGESAMETMLMDLIENQINPTIAPYAKEAEVNLRITAKCAGIEEGERLLEPMVAEVCRRLGDHVYSTSGENLEEVAVRLLSENNQSIAFAESCTGGLIAYRLTSIPGVSNIFRSGFVTYGNDAKMRDLGVCEKTLENYGAVSEQTAREMAEGARERAGSSIAVAVTGIAGPDGGSIEKPVGTVYVAITGYRGTYCKRFNIHGNRERIRNVTAMNAFNFIRMYILGKDISVI